MAIDSHTLVELVNNYREQILADTDTGEDAMAVTAFLLLTFGVDASPTRAIGAPVREVMVEAVDWAIEQAREIGFQPESGN